MKLSYLLKGPPGHPLHPPLTDATIGAYTVAVALAIGSKIGLSSHPAGYGWWLALVVALAASVLTAVTGLIDWLTITWWTPMWKTATLHLLIMVTATVIFLVAVLVGHAGYRHGNVETGPFILTIAGYGLLTVGGWIGGTITFVHGMRVLGLPDLPASQAISPLPDREEEEAEA